MLEFNEPKIILTFFDQTEEINMNQNKTKKKIIPIKFSKLLKNTSISCGLNYFNPIHFIRRMKLNKTTNVHVNNAL